MTRNLEMCFRLMCLRLYLFLHLSESTNINETFDINIIKNERRCLNKLAGVNFFSSFYFILFFTQIAEFMYLFTLCVFEWTTKKKFAIFRATNFQFTHWTAQSPTTTLSSAWWLQCYNPACLTHINLTYLVMSYKISFPI